MRFVAVFNQHQVPHTLGFASAVEASDFLFWGYEDQHLLPYGVYDQATVYTHAGQLVHAISEELIYSMAKRHLTTFRRSTHRQSSQAETTTYS